MRNRPWPIVILSFLYLLGPLFNTLAGAMILRISYPQYLTILFQYSPWWEILSVMTLYPLAGIAIYAVRPWSYPVYLTVMAVSIYGNIMNWQQFSGPHSLPIFIGGIALNLGMVSYFLIPAVRAAYFNPRLRWWEAKPRYQVHAPGELTAEGGGAAFKCTLGNLSEGGAFLRCAKNLELGKEYRLQFPILDQQLDTRVMVAYRLWTGARGYGVQFVHDRDSRKRLRRVTRGLALLGVRNRDGRKERWASFRKWVADLFIHGGKGFIPEWPPNGEFSANEEKGRKAGKKAA